MQAMDYLLAVALGVSLAAAAGLRVFVPLLVTAVAARLGWFEPAPALAWMAGMPAILTLAVAALIEIAGYYLPGVDNMLDALTTPLALIAGTLVVVAPLWDQPPLLKWSIGIIAGGGAAALTQGLSALLRAKSTLATGGLANPAVATGELGGSLLLSVLAVLVPVVALGLAVLMLLLAWRLLRRLLRRAGAPRDAPAG